MHIHAWQVLAVVAGGALLAALTYAIPIQLRDVFESAAAWRDAGLALLDDED